jgi:hypothetical protein
MLLDEVNMQLNLYQQLEVAQIMLNGFFQILDDIEYDILQIEQVGVV